MQKTFKEKYLALKNGKVCFVERDIPSYRIHIVRHTGRGTWVRVGGKVYRFPHALGNALKYPPKWGQASARRAVLAYVATLNNQHHNHV